MRKLMSLTLALLMCFGMCGRRESLSVLPHIEHANCHASSICVSVTFSSVNFG